MRSFSSKKAIAIARGHFQHVMDRSATDTDLQDVRLKAASFAFRAAQVKVAEKLHLDLFEADARSSVRTGRRPR